VIDCEQVVIVGAGPYGLSLAAHLSALGMRFRIFGSPMSTWREHMPQGMLLKSDGFASSLSDPTSSFALRHYCAEKNIAYDDTRIPVTLDTFISYGLSFQERFVPRLEQRQVIEVARETGMFRIVLDNNEVVHSQKVVLAVGITHFRYIPPVLSKLPPAQMSHSSAFHELSSLGGSDVTVVGSGASGLDLAALLHENGVNVTLLSRNRDVYFHDAPGSKPRSLLKRMRHPGSPIGPGWRSRFYTGAPLLFHRLPSDFRLKVVRTHLRPAAGWPMKERVLGRVPIICGYTIDRAEVQNGRVRLNLIGSDGGQKEHLSNIVIAATGYRADLRRLEFLHDDLLSQITSLEHTPVLSSDFQSSAPGLYFLGLAAANSFGPLLRFACGSDFAARRLSAKLAK
jgi:putative flavoprotein involved in K+ transport